MTVDLEREVGRLQGVIADAIAALDEKRLGDVRRILKTGKAEPVKAMTGVIARDGGAA
ncbi:hypothetical protein [uncultured Devosia sp.]|uniref:hypothetical protein n=1 Tax=uncultured Devosia sp. TaxID=211434 RepID=UPI00262A5DEF|nr:hypothetical protein [uncultured Devosia sp.]